MSTPANYIVFPDNPPAQRPPLDLPARERLTEQVRLRLIELGFVAKAKEKA